MARPQSRETMDRKNQKRQTRYHRDPKYRAEVIAKATEWAKKNPEKYLLRSARFRAKRLGLPCTISHANLTIPDVCPVLGIPIRMDCNKQRDNSPSIDRLIPSLGYVPGNVAVISWRANRLKSDATLDEAERIAAWMRSHKEKNHGQS